MAENQDQQGQAPADETTSGSTSQPAEDHLQGALQDFAHNIFANRDDKEKWQAVLNGASDDIVRLIGQFPKLLSDILSADSEKAVDEIVAKAQQGNASLSSTTESIDAQKRPDASDDTATEQGSGATATDVAAQTKIASENDDESPGDSEKSDPGVDSIAAATEVNTSDATLTDDETAVKTNADTVQDAKQSQSSAVSSAALPDQRDRGQPAGAQTEQSPAADDDICSNDMLADFLRQIFEKKNDDAALEKCLQKADSAILNRLDANPFYLSRVLAMTNDNDLEDLLSILKQVDGPLYAEDANAMSQLTEEEIDYLLDCYAHIEFDCDIANQDNDKLRQLLSYASPALMTSIGVPIQCRLSKDGRVMTASVSMRGDFTGFEATTAVQVADNEVDTFLPDIDGSLPMKRMQLANELVSMIQGMQLENVKMRAGRRLLMRSFWALLQVNNIPYSGFEPTPAEQAWYDKRAHYLSDQFAPQQVLSSSAAPKMGMGGRMTSADNYEESAASDESPKSPVDETTKPDLARELTDKQAVPSSGVATKASSAPDNSSSTTKESSSQEGLTETDDGMRKKKSSASATKSPAKKRAVKASTTKQAAKKQSVVKQDAAVAKAKKTPKKTEQSPAEDDNHQ